MLCWWCQSNTYQPYSSKTTKFSLIFEEKRGDGIEGEEYRRRISKRGGGREDCAAVIEELLEGTPIVDVIFVLLCLKSYCSIWNLLKKVGSLASYSYSYIQQRHTNVCQLVYGLASVCMLYAAFLKRHCLLRFQYHGLGNIRASLITFLCLAAQQQQQSNQHCTSIEQHTMYDVGMQQPSSQSCDVIYLYQMEMLLLMNVNGCCCVGYFSCCVLIIAQL